MATPAKPAQARPSLPNATKPAQPELVEGPAPPLADAMAFYAYLLRCNDRSYYAGHTDDLELRMAQHATGALGGYTAKRLPVVLVWSDSFQTRDDAFAVEWKIKGWSRAKKEALIAGDWQLISQLARGRTGRRDQGEGGAGPSTSSG